MEDYEKLGSFYLGKKYDLDSQKITDNLILYESKDLTTHAVCIGMTGSGKTGLCLSLLEEAAIDGIPAIIIDPKGDMTNLLLNFPNQLPEDFLPWINKDEALQNNLAAEEFAAKIAATWTKGLADWGQSKERLKKITEGAEFAIYTPGSSAGLAVSILDSFAAPPSQIRDDFDLFQERVSSTVSSLLGLLGIDADPIKSKEHIFISNILTHYWQQGENLDLELLIRAMQKPPFAKIGIMDLESFYPEKERMELALSLNNLLASPAFKTWMEGEPFEVNNFLYNAAGKAKLSIFYIAHLSEAERMFFVSLLFNQVLGWVRTQAGTLSLRALLYFDEIFGYMPPVSNPPSKKPLLTLLKQARAFGLGIVLATQNPVDLDYKGLANIGTWFIGRLQTERDRAKVLDGIAAEATEDKVDRRKMEEVLSKLGKRVFLLHNVHEQAPEVFQSRWAMSYLAGPLTREQIKKLVKQPSIPPEKAAQKKASLAHSAERERPVFPSEISQYFAPLRSLKPENASLIYQPFIWGSAEIHFVDKPLQVDSVTTAKYLAPAEDKVLAVQWEQSSAVDYNENDFLRDPEDEANYAAVSAAVLLPKNYATWKNDFLNYLFRSQSLTLCKSLVHNIVSLPGENERDFRIRLSQFAREKRDEWTEELRKKYAQRTATIENKIRTAEDRIAREQNQAQQQKIQTAISIGTTILGAFLGRKAISRSTIGHAGTTMNRATRAMKEHGDIQRAEENLTILQQQLKELQEDFQREVETYTEKFNVMEEALQTVTIKPLKSNIAIKLFTFIWIPFWKLDSGEMKQA